MEFLIYVYVLIGFILLVVIAVGYSILKEAKLSATLGGDPERRRWKWITKWRRKRKKRKKNRHHH